MAVLVKVRELVGEDLDRIAATERRLNGEVAGLLQQYQASRQQHAQVSSTRHHGSSMHR